jgi:hypothetical protein
MGLRGWLMVLRRRQVGNCKSVRWCDGLVALVWRFYEDPALASGFPYCCLKIAPLPPVVFPYLMLRWSIKRA